MASFKDRKEKQINPVESTVLGIAGKEPAAETKKKYTVTVVFDGELEEPIKKYAKENGIGVATLIKMLVKKELNK